MTPSGSGSPTGHVAGRWPARTCGVTSSRTASSPSVGAGTCSATTWTGRTGARSGSTASREPFGTRSRFRAREVPGGDAAAYVRKGLSRNETRAVVRALVQAPASRRRGAHRPLGDGDACGRPHLPGRDGCRATRGGRRSGSASWRPRSPSRRRRPRCSSCAAPSGRHASPRALEPGNERPRLTIGG